MSKFEELTEKLDQEADFYTEQSYIIKSLALIFGIIVMKVIMGGFLFWCTVTFALFNYAVYLWINTDMGIWGIFKQNISITGAPRVEGKERIKIYPWGTWGIVAINVFVFIFLQTPENKDFIQRNLYFLPHDPSLINVPISLFTSMYLHADEMHIFGNMSFLWAVGRVVERRVGTRQFLKLYHMTGIAGSFFAVLIYSIIGSSTHCLGASGAIAGIMGVFLIRCYFKRMTFPFYAFGVLPVNLNLQVNGLVVIALFFCSDFKGGLKQLIGVDDSLVGHMNHLGGMFSGIWFAWRMKLGDGAVAERHLDIGDAVFDGKNLVGSGFEAAGGLDGARKSLLIALKKEPHNPDTLLALARVESHLVGKPEGQEYYQRSINILFSTTPEKAVEVFREYYPRYRVMLEPTIQFRICAMLQRQGHLELAEQALMQLADYGGTPQDIREQALFYSGRILEQLALPEPAARYYRRFLAEYPQSLRIEAVSARLAMMQLTEVADSSSVWNGVGNES